VAGFLKFEVWSLKFPASLRLLRLFRRSFDEGGDKDHKTPVQLAGKLLWMGHQTVTRKP
jgi:hypothetical protein